MSKLPVLLRERWSCWFIHTQHQSKRWALWYVLICPVAFVAHVPQEPECCDGSDEAEGVCPNVCKEIGAEYRERLKADNKLRKTVHSFAIQIVLLCSYTCCRAPRFVRRILLLHRRRRSV